MQNPFVMNWICGWLSMNFFHALDLKYQLKINASLKHTNQFGSEDLDDCYLSRAAKLKED